MNPVCEGNDNSFEETVENFLDSHISTECNDCNNVDILSEPIKRIEIEKAVRELNCGKSPGLDGIPPEFFKNAPFITQY